MQHVIQVRCNCGQAQTILQKPIQNLKTKAMVLTAVMVHFEAQLSTAYRVNRLGDRLVLLCLRLVLVISSSRLPQWSFALT